jgi:CRP-like cAMP-binding protein
MLYNSLFQHISQKVQLSALEMESCKAYFEPVKFAKNTLIEKQGAIPTSLYFVVLGYMRLFYCNENGDEITTYISSPSGFIASFHDFINGTKAKENVGSITECKVLRISKENMKAFIQQSENFRNFSTTIFEHAMVQNEARANDLATLTAEQRYKKLIDNHSAIIKNVPVQCIASYLGIKPESLSRIRKQIIT